MGFVGYLQEVFISIVFLPLTASRAKFRILVQIFVISNHYNFSRLHNTALKFGMFIIENPLFKDIVRYCCNIFPITKEIRFYDSIINA